MTQSDDPRAGESGPAGADESEEIDGTFSVALTLTRGFAFDVNPNLPTVPGFVIDEPPPVGEGKGMPPARALVSAMAGCLGSTLLYCLNKAQIGVKSLRIEAGGTYVRNARKRLRIGSVHIKLHPEVDEADRARMERCLEIFEDYCVITESVKRGIPTTVGVETHSA